MADSVTEKNRDDSAPTSKKLDDLYQLIDGIEVAMFTTRRPDGQLMSRPMATQKRLSGTDLWFVTDITSHKLDDLLLDPHVNLAYYNSKSREWVSVSGTAIVSQDRDLIEGFYKPDWKAWFPENGNKDTGTSRDPRIALILVEALSVEYLKINKPRPVVLFEVAKAMITGSTPSIGKERSLDENELKLKPAGAR